MPRLEPVEPKRATMRITDLHLRTIIGINGWERTHRQDVVINVSMEFDPSTAIRTGALSDTLDYRRVKRHIIECVEQSEFGLLEQLTHAVLEAVMSQQRVLAATVRIDKPHALHFARSASVEMSAERNG